MGVQYSPAMPGFVRLAPRLNIVPSLAFGSTARCVYPSGSLSASGFSPSAFDIGLQRSTFASALTPPEITHLREADLPAVADALSRAFQNDPLQVYTLPDPAERALLSPPLFAAALRYGLLFGEVLTNVGPPAGAAIWLGPDAWKITPERAGAAGFDRLPDEMGTDAADRFFSALSVAEQYHHTAMPPKHWYVMVVGVAPEAQGTGLGRALLQPFIDRAAAAGLPCYLETANQSNISFYERLGFSRIAELTEPRSGLRFWTFRRDALKLDQQK